MIQSIHLGNADPKGIVGKYVVFPASELGIYFQCDCFDPESGYYFTSTNSIDPDKRVHVKLGSESIFEVWGNVGSCEGFYSDEEKDFLVRAAENLLEIGCEGSVSRSQAYDLIYKRMPPSAPKVPQLLAIHHPLESNRIPLAWDGRFDSAWMYFAEEGNKLCHQIKSACPKLSSKNLAEKQVVLYFNFGMDFLDENSMRYLAEDFAELFE